MNDILNSILEQIGMPLWLFAVIITWGAVWKMIALWKASRKKELAWFIIMSLVNTFGVLEIFYIFVFSKIKFNYKKFNKSKKKKR